MCGSNIGRYEEKGNGRIMKDSIGNDNN